MNTREQGFLLLTGYFGDKARKPLTIAQFRKVAALARTMARPTQQRELMPADLMALGCEPKLAENVVYLLSHEKQLNWYLNKGSVSGCRPITRISESYPARLRGALQLDAPGVLWVKGDESLLGQKSISVVGSRDLREDNTVFAKEVGKQAAYQGYVLVSGNARGADRTAQESCLSHGGKVICVVADSLENQPTRENVLYISEEGFDLPFSSQRALYRNRIIHSFSELTFVVQCHRGKGGTWSGTRNNLLHGLSRVAVYDDGTEACQELICSGAVSATTENLQNFNAFIEDKPAVQQSLF